MTPKICSRGKLTIEADATLYVSDNKLTGANPPQPGNHPSNTLPYNDGRRVLPGIRSNTVKRKTVKVEWNCLDGEVRETILG